VEQIELKARGVLNEKKRLKAYQFFPPQPFVCSTHGRSKQTGMYCNDCGEKMVNENSFWNRVVKKHLNVFKKKGG